jgi:flagella basal body P-ring formation protein FlgA
MRTFVEIIRTIVRRIDGGLNVDSWSLPSAKRGLNRRGAEDAEESKTRFLNLPSPRPLRLCGSIDFSAFIAVLIAVLIVLALFSQTPAASGQDADNTDTPDLSAQTGAQIDSLPAQEHFVTSSPDSAWFASSAAASRGRLVLRPDATVADGQIHLSNVCRWSPDDAGMFNPVADLTVASFPKGRLYTKVTVDDIRQTLGGAGLNVAMISFCGSMECAVNRPDASSDQTAKLQDWLNAAGAQPASAVQPPGADQSTIAPPPVSDSSQALHSLRTILGADLAARLNVDPSTLELSFDAGSDKVLNLAEPFFQFQVQPVQCYNLGDVSWTVTITYQGKQQQVDIAGVARAWKTEAILLNPLACRQTIRDTDIEERRVLVARLPEEPLLTKANCVGQAASRDLKPGMVLTSSMVNPVLLAQAGQLVTVTVVHGTFKITAVARAQEGGTYGQTIRVRSDTDSSLQYAVTLTGPQEGTVVAGSEQVSNSSGNVN